MSIRERPWEDSKEDGDSSKGGDNNRADGNNHSNSKDGANSLNRVVGVVIKAVGDSNHSSKDGVEIKVGGEDSKTQIRVDGEVNKTQTRVAGIKVVIRAVGVQTNKDGTMDGDDFLANFNLRMQIKYKEMILEQQLFSYLNVFSVLVLKNDDILINLNSVYSVL